MKKNLLYCLFSLPCFFSLANPSDSLIQLLSTKLPDTTKLVVLKELLYLNNTSDPSQAIFYGQQGLSLAKKIADSKAEIQFLNNLGIAYYGMGDYEKTLTYFLSVLENETNAGNPQSLSRAMNNVGIIYDEIGRLDKAADFYEKSLKIKKELNDSAGISNTMSNLGLVYMKMDKPELALTYFRACLILDKSMDYDRGIYNSLHNIGLYHKDYGNADSAVFYMKASLQRVPENEDHYDKTFIVKSLAESLLKQRDFQEALLYFEQAIALAKKIESPEVLKEAYKGIAAIYEVNGDYQRALLAFKNFKLLNDSIYNLDLNQKVSRLEKNYEIKSKEKEIELLTNKAALTEVQLSRRKNTNNFLIVLGVLLGITLVVIYNRYQLKIKANTQLSQKNEEITLQKTEIKENRDEIEAQRDSILEQKQALEEASSEILKSIWYAQNIQQAILPDLNKISDHFTDFFLLYMPKSIVSGDFYWFTEKKGRIYFALADCTGHGIPGAFMTVMANDLLKSIIIQRDVDDCAAILQLLDEEVINSLQYKENSSSDGLDIALICIDKKNELLHFSGASMNLLYHQNNSWAAYKGERFSIGGFKDPNLKKSKSIEINYLKGDQFYIYTDGYVDQFGGANDKKFLKKRLLPLLEQLKDSPFSTQKNELEKSILEWKGNQEQTDDIAFVGIKI